MKGNIHGFVSVIEINKFIKQLSLQNNLSNNNMGVYKKLSELTIGKQAIIKSFQSDELFIKLMEMGCIPGEKIIVEQIAPLKDPISIHVAGYRLSLRLDEAEHIIVEEIN